MKKLLSLAAALFASAILHAQAASVTLIWEPSPDAATVVGYNVYQLGSPMTKVATTTTATTVQVQNLVAGTSYSWFVTAVNKDGLESDPSNTASFTPAPGVPPAPLFASQAIKQLNSTQWQIDVAIQPIAASYAVTNYYVIITQGATVTKVPLGTALSKSITVPRFSPTSTAIQAENYLGLSAITPGVIYGAPGKSPNLRVTAP
jgi:hypothetical protein